MIRFKGNIAVTAASGEIRTASVWVRANGAARVLRAPRSPPIATQLISYTGHRRGIERGLRDTKDMRFGMGLGTMPANPLNCATGCG